MKDVIEVSPDSAITSKEIANRLQRHGGCALIIDYGDFGTGSDTIRVRKKLPYFYTLLQ